MNVVLAPDSFKECLSAPDACRCMARGITPIIGCNAVSVPMADGGEGTGKILAQHLNAQRISVVVRDPLRRDVQAGFYLADDGQTAIVETAEANGLGLLEPCERNPEKADSYGCGELIRAALKSKAETVLVAVGGSSTVDGGKGMAEALGYRFLDEFGQPLVPGAASLRYLAQIQAPSPGWHGSNVVVLCDVTNPLLGVAGAAPVFAPQKGADPKMVLRLEEGLVRLAECITSDLGFDVSGLNGGGAAGGLGAGLAAFLGADLTSGAERVAETVGLERVLLDADILITGEGRVDGQSLRGKLLSIMLRLAKRHSVPVAVIGGMIQCERATLRAAGIQYWRELALPGEPKESAMEEACERLAAAAASVVEAFRTDCSAQ